MNHPYYEILYANLKIYNWADKTNFKNKRIPENKRDSVLVCFALGKHFYINVSFVDQSLTKSKKKNGAYTLDK